MVEAIDKLKVSEADALLRYLENPVPSSLLLIVGTKLDGKRKYAKVLKKSGPVLEFGTPKPYQDASVASRRGPHSKYRH